MIFRCVGKYCQFFFFLRCYYRFFDSLHPPLLLAKLKACGFSDSAIRLLRSYFSERKNRVKIGMKFTSEWKTVLRGCPQGSNFGPLLWNIVQNDMVYNINKSGLTMYADDHQMYYNGERTEDVEKTLTEKGKYIFSWYQKNLLKCNPNKFQAISFGQKHKKNEMNIQVMNNNIKSKSEMKLLGVTIDEHLKRGVN